MGERSWHPAQWEHPHQRGGGGSREGLNTLPLFTAGPHVFNKLNDKKKIGALIKGLYWIVQ